MKYISIDIETTGLDPEKDQILEIGAIIEDSKLKLDFNSIPKFKCIIEHSTYNGSAYAINMNQRIFEILAKIPKQKENAKKYREKYNILTLENACYEYNKFLLENYIEKGYTAAGKNYAGFDNLFLKKISSWPKSNQRVLDPGSLYVNWDKDFLIPNLEQCKERAGLLDIEIKHDALLDAWDVIRVLRTRY